MARVFVGIGSNSEPERHLRLAVQALRQRFGALRCSTIYASAPVGFEGPDFLNLVVGFDAADPPRALVATLKALEQELSQTRTPRGLDLDLLLYDDLVLDEDGLRLPRADIERYAFVLRPLAELAPEQRHPVTRQRFADMWAAFPAHGQPLRPVEVQLWRERRARAC